MNHKIITEIMKSYIDQAIEKAHDAGYRSGHAWESVDEWWAKTAILQQPSFWQSLGKALGWGDVIKGLAIPMSKEQLLRIVAKTAADKMTEKTIESILRMDNIEQWKFHWHRFIDHLAEGKDAESYFEALLK